MQAITQFAKVALTIIAAIVAVLGFLDLFMGLGGIGDSFETRFGIRLGELLLAVSVSALFIVLFSHERELEKFRNKQAKLIIAIGNTPSTTARLSVLNDGIHGADVSATGIFKPDVYSRDQHSFKFGWQETTEAIVRILPGDEARLVTITIEHDGDPNKLILFDYQQPQIKKVCFPCPNANERPKQGLLTVKLAAEPNIGKQQLWEFAVVYRADLLQVAPTYRRKGMPYISRIIHPKGDLFDELYK